MTTLDPRDNFKNKPAREPDARLFGEGAPPDMIPGWDDADVVYRSVFFDGLPTDEYPRGWWAADLWKRQA